MKAGNEPLECHGDIDLESELVVRRNGLETLSLGLDLVEGIAHRREIGMSCRSELGPAGIAREELEAKLLLERLHLVAHRRAGDAELAAREPERAKTGGCLEGGQSTKGWKVAARQEF